MAGQGRRTWQDDQCGLTLVELLVAIVVVGVLGAVAVVGIDGLREKGVSAACATTMDAANAAAAAYYSISDGAYPQTYTDLTNPPSGRALLEPKPAVVASATTLKGKGWTLTLQPGATPEEPTTFSGC